MAIASSSAAVEKRSRSMSGFSQKTKWADWEEDELSPDSDASTSAHACTDSSSGDESGSDASPKMPPGQFCAATQAPSAPAALVPMSPQQVFLVPVLMNGVQVLMPMVAAPSLCSAGPPATSTELRGAAPDSARKTVEEGRTTLMFRNLPKSYRRSDLLQILDEEGFQGSYCFVYVPTDFKRLAGFGYAFVAFHRPEEAVRAKQHFQGYTWAHEPSVQACDVAWSGPVQGRQQHVERYRNSPVMHATVPDEYKPAVFDAHGERLPFPAPTRAIQPPRLRHGISGEVLGPGASDEN